MNILKVLRFTLNFANFVPVTFRISYSWEQVCTSICFTLYRLKALKYALSHICKRALMSSLTSIPQWRHAIIFKMLCADVNKRDVYAWLQHISGRFICLFFKQREIILILALASSRTFRSWEIDCTKYNSWC